MEGGERREKTEDKGEERENGGQGRGGKRRGERAEGEDGGRKEKMEGGQEIERREGS